MNHDHTIAAAPNWQAMYNNLLDSLNIAFIVCDLNFLIKRVNKCYTQMTGFRRDQLEGRHISELYNRDEFRILQETVATHRKNDQYQYESILSCANGDRIPVVNSSHINRDAHGNAESVNVLITDIREQKEIQTHWNRPSRPCSPARKHWKKRRECWKPFSSGSVIA